MDIKIAEFFEKTPKLKTRDANHIMPKTKIPDLAWDDWTPATVNDQDKLAVANGQVENLECQCIDCSPVIEEINTVIEISEIEHTISTTGFTTPPEKTNKWNPITSFYRNFFLTALTKIKIHVPRKIPSNRDITPVRTGRTRPITGIF